ncbi:DnaD domain protein [Fictibacillus sp. 7GRE50]|uniref:DnaD domain protein n=1 Tax=Fictibacillus sp. 7GRE50 TaxID=2745878 RepID=UPI0018CCCB6B|nr:DnaD domain protein [Fictibacillus sp. 7GRE50]MBH0167163.1 DnaD domain protein [Fictibacillus sp. 7GRE50]
MDKEDDSKVFIEMCETLRPADILREYAEIINVPVSNNDLKLAKRLQESGLKDNVINVLFDFALRFSDRLNHKFVERIASNWLKKEVISTEQAMDFLREEHKRYLELKIRKDQINKVKPAAAKKKHINEFNMYDLRYMEKLRETYDMEAIVSREIILYSKRINNGLLVYWFMDRLAEYLAGYNPVNEESTRTLIDTFHEKYVVGFGKR